MESKKKVISLGILLSILFLISAAYAWLKISVVSDVKHVIHAGKLDLVLNDDESDGINMRNAVPISDKKGREQEGYTFKLINRGTLSSRYTLYLDDLSLEVGEERMKDSVVKYSLERDGVELSSGLLPEIGSNPNRILDTGIINGKTTYVYVLKVWMDQEATMENQGTIFYTKIRAEAEQTNMPIEKSELELTPESKERVPIKDGEDPKKYTYTSSDWNVVKVDEEGNIEVIGPGTAVIIKTDQYGTKEEITVHVTVPVEATFETNDKIELIGNIENNICNLTENNQTTCQIDLPEVEVIDGYEFVGWSTDSNSHEGKKENIEISLDKKILYPIIKIPGETLTVSIVKQGDGVEEIGTDSVTCDIKDTYNNETPNTSCEITLPTITAKEGYEIIGWSTNSGATTGIKPGTIVEISGDTTYYTIYKKPGKELNATFMINGAKSLTDLNEQTTSRLEDGSLRITCTVPESYNGVSKDSCKIMAPKIEPSTATPNIIGFNENINAIESTISDTITISENKTYYALTKSETKQCVATFYRNGAKSLGGDTSDIVTKQCNMEITYNGTPQIGCNIEVPSIEASTNTPEVLGYSTARDLHEEDTTYVNSAGNILITGDVSYYAQTANKDLVSYEVTYQKGSHVVNIEKDQDACSVAPSYNGEKRAESCTVNAPDYTVDDGYRKVGYHEEKDVKEGVVNTITLTKENTIFYANATLTAITVEYYSDGESFGTSSAEVGESITLIDYEKLGIEKKGYTFKGWDTEESAATVQKGNEDVISGLEEGTVMRLYAVWIDDIPPVCKYTVFHDSYNVTDNSLQITITCTDEGSGFNGNPWEMIMPQSNSTHFDKLIDQADVTVQNFNFSPKGVSSGMCSYSENKDTMICNIGIYPNCATDNGIITVAAGSVSDKSGNKNEKLVSDVVKINPYTYSATLTSTDIEGVESGSSTRSSCTTVGPYNTCSINFDNINLREGYRWAGWNEDKTSKTGVMSMYLTNNVTLFPTVAPIFIDAYRYDQDIPEGEIGHCITGEEATCQKTDCYQSADGCNNGTIFKYAVKSDYPESHRVNNLDDYIYYFYVMHDDGDKLTLQQKDDLLKSPWSADGIEITEGPVTAINKLKDATDDWGYVEDLTYTYGTTAFSGNSFTGCDYPDSGLPFGCSSNAYTSSAPINAKARLVTVPELQQVGCSAQEKSCPLWVLNDLDAELYMHYWTSNAHNVAPAGQLQGMAVFHYGNIVYLDKKQNVGIRPVIELTKEKLTNWKK